MVGMSPPIQRTHHGSPGLCVREMRRLSWTVYSTTPQAPACITVLLYRQ